MQENAFRTVAPELLEHNRRRLDALVETGKNQRRDRDYRPVAGTVLTREYQGVHTRVAVTADGQYDFQGRNYPSLSMIAREITGTRWSGPLFFGLEAPAKQGDPVMSEALKRRLRCAVYSRVSTDERLDQEFNSIDAQKEAGHAYIASQRAEGWIPVADDYDDPAYSGGNTDRPALKRLLADIQATDRHRGDLQDRPPDAEPRRPSPRWSRCSSAIAFLSSRTQQFEPTTMGRLMLKSAVLCQFEREVTGAHPRQNRRQQTQGDVDGRVPPLTTSLTGG